MTNFQEENLTHRDHEDPDKHWIGGALGVPTQTEIAATVGVAAAPGFSPFPARADHQHKIETQLLPVFISQFPSSGINATTGTSFVTWITIDPTDVPVWATKALIQINVDNAIMSAAGAAAYTFNLAITGGSYVGDYGSLILPASDSGPITFCQEVSGFTVGFARNILLGARRVSGAGVLSVDSTSKITGFIMYKP